MHQLSQTFQSAILRATGATGLEVSEVIQQLWSGYGEILRVSLEGGDVDQVVVKHVRLPVRKKHPRGWDTDRSHERKVRSYEVEMNWYREMAARCGEGCRLPSCLAFERNGDEVLLVLEDLDAAGFAGRGGAVEPCLRWLANFHGTFMGAKTDGLWETGTYWHLDTRPDELEVLEDEELKSAAAEIDRRLSEAQYQTLVHGDAKLANFCFSEDGARAAAVDFQYVGGGCGMKDVAYLIGSCLGESECEAREAALLDLYFAELAKVCDSISEVEQEWRGLYHLAWTDFHRFLKGWSPGHWKINSYSERLKYEVVASLD